MLLPNQTLPARWQAIERIAQGKLNDKLCRRMSKSESTIVENGDNRSGAEVTAQYRMSRAKIRNRVKQGYETLRGSMPSFFMREISVVRLMSIRAAAP